MSWIALGERRPVLAPAPDPLPEVELLDLVRLVAALARVLLEAEGLEVARVDPRLVEVVHGVELRDVVVRRRRQGDPVDRDAVGRRFVGRLERHLAALDLEPRDRVDERLARAERHGEEPVFREGLAGRDDDGRPIGRRAAGARQERDEGGRGGERARGPAYARSRRTASRTSSKGHRAVGRL